MYRQTNRGVVMFIILTLIAIFLTLFVFGYFTEQHPFGLPNFRQSLHLACGLTVQAPKKANLSVTFPYIVKGYANGCGWDPTINGTIGTVTLLASNGLVLSTATVSASDPTGGDPYYFEATLSPTLIFIGDTGTIVFENTLAGFDHHIVRIPIRFGS
jgi:hypothetical protein